MAGVVSATKEDFRDLVADGVVLVDVWGPSCAPCLALMPHVEALAQRRTELRVVKVEAPKARRLCMELKVMGLPAFLLFRDGTEVARLAEPDLGPARLDAWLDESLHSERK
jgi:thiol-disulfide isomerase/thioredoxin